jgi:hypothetical protein
MLLKTNGVKKKRKITAPSALRQIAVQKGIELHEPLLVRFFDRHGRRRHD